MKTLQMNTETPTEKAFNTIMRSSLFRTDGSEIDLCPALITLCDAIKAEDETNWCLGEHGECSLDSLLIGAYWALCEWHAGQASPEYAALCAVGSIFDPGHTSPPKSDDETEYHPYVAINNYFAKRHRSPEQVM